uniref:ATP-dependent Clp protease proteolytic subunit n=1 Tax=Edaphochlamys debaryana TaxID=47281 RepID=UPI0022A7FAFF|nr:ATP-dependent Clp protease proteolytic subunit [Edaphochlamys debaryana]UZS90708.1 ATP-dependent Clp protease proteolytic subunit [Edaphochlamys debaryana]
MPIGVPRIIYCWGEELPAQWTDIYNFIFRRRMVFLMQYLDDELCNQICGLLINIHMEDRSKELEKKEMEKSGLFKSSTAKSKVSDPLKKENLTGKDISAKSRRQSVEDLLTSDQDFGIEDNHMLEQYTLQKITTEWLNWNAQFFDYSDEPYLYYLADILSKDFSKESATLKYGTNNTNTSSPQGQKEITKLIKNLKSIKNISSEKNKVPLQFLTESKREGQGFASANLDVYSPFRLLANFSSQNYNLENLTNTQGGSFTNQKNKQLLALLKNSLNNVDVNHNSSTQGKTLIDKLAQTEFSTLSQTQDKLLASSEKALGQRRLKREYIQERLGTHRLEPWAKGKTSSKAYNYLDQAAVNRSLYRKQTERVIQEEESKKVFMIINSFGGSVGNGITVHDALQFIKAGSLTLALGVAASAASLALAGGTIGERYVTEGCHTMIHQPEGGLNGQASDIWIDSQEIMKIRLDVAEIYSLSTYRPRHKILRDLDRDFYLTAMETIYYGLADEIATNEVLHDIIEMTSKVWDYHDTKQQRLLETRDSQTSGLDTQTQS